MFRLPALVVIFSLCTGCVSSAIYENMHPELYQPKVETTGGPAILYSLSQEQLKNYFPNGASRSSIQQKYGAPTTSGNAQDKDGQPTTSITYTYTRTYSHMDTNYTSLIIASYHSLMLTFDSADKLVATNSSNSATLIDRNGQQRTPTDAELTQYLGPRESAIAPALATSSAAPATGVRLGIQVFELTPAQIAAAGLKSGGAMVGAVEPGGLAATKGLLSGDIVVKLNGGDIAGQADFVNKIRNRAAGDELVLQVLTNGKMRTVAIQSAAGAPASL